MGAGDPHHGIDGFGGPCQRVAGCLDGCFGIAAKKEHLRLQPVAARIVGIRPHQTLSSRERGVEVVSVNVDIDNVTVCDPERGIGRASCRERVSLNV